MICSPLNHNAIGSESKGVGFVVFCFVLFCSRVNLLSPTSEFRAKAVSVQLC